MILTGCGRGRDRRCASGGAGAVVDDDEGGCEDESVSDAGTDAGADADARERVWTMVGPIGVREREREWRGAA